MHVQCEWRSKVMMKDTDRGCTPMTLESDRGRCGYGRLFSKNQLLKGCLLVFNLLDLSTQHVPVRATAIAA